MLEAKIRLVCATRESAEDFHTRTALGKSLAMYGFYGSVELRLFANNSFGLPRIYNEAIAESKASPAILVFIHDDIHLSDYFWAFRILEGLEQFHVIGIVGNKRRVPKQPSWAQIDDRFTWDARENLSGIVGQGTGFPCHNLCVFGPSMQEVKLLDGILLACRSSVLLESGVRFDERFDFHFYDQDFCRQAEEKGLRMGTWPIAVVHESDAQMSTDAWKGAYGKYLDKWRQ